jgi:hypothetical protein
MTQQAFVQDIAASGWRADAAALVWDRLVESGVDPSFSPYPDDDLADLFDCVEEDLEDGLIIETCRRLGLEIPTQALVDQVGLVDTPRQVVRLISLCPPASHAPPPVASP